MHIAYSFGVITTATMNEQFLRNLRYEINITIVTNSRTIILCLMDMRFLRNIVLRQLIISDTTPLDVI